MRVIDYRQEHLADLMDGELSNGTHGHVFVKTYAESLELPGWSFTILDHGHLIACVGISEMWEGVGEAWFVGSARLHQKSREKKHKLCRVQAACRADWAEALRFAKFMGFEEEGLMKKYGHDGEDFIRLAKIYGS